MNVNLDFDKEKINTTLNQLRNFQENFLQWTVENESPAKYPEDILWFLQVFNEVDKHFVEIMKKLWDADSGQSNDQPNECQVCRKKDLHIREKDLHINELEGMNKEQLEIIKELLRQIEALKKANDLQEPVDNIKEGYAEKPDDTHTQNKKVHELQQEVKQLRQWVKELLPGELKNQSEPKK